MRRFVPVFLGLAVANGGHAELNLGFEALDRDAMPLGWTVASGGTDVGSDTPAVEGARSLRVTRSTPGVARVRQRVAAASLRAAGAPRAMRLRLTGSARVAASSVSAALWLRIDGPHGPLFLDSGGFAREPAGEAEAALPAAHTDAGGWRRFEIELPFPSDTEEVAFGVSSRGQGTAWFDALELEAVATDAWPPASPAAVRYLDAALALMREHSLRRADVDWPSLRVEALEHARGAVVPSEAHLAVRFAVRELGDRHSYLQSPAATQALATTAVSNARTGSPLTAPHGQRLGGNLGYLNVPGFAGGTPLQQVEFAEKVKNIIQATDEAGVCGWVVDLRQDTGGNLWPMLAGLGPLLGDGELAASVYPGGRRVPVWYRDGQAGFGDYTQLRVRSPYRLSDDRMPVALLLGPATASSAEVLAVAFRSHPETRSFGAATRGLSAGNRTFGLADGASLVLTVAATTDRAGRVYAGPIVPDEVVARTAQPSGAEESADAVVAAAVAWLVAGDSCR